MAGELRVLILEDITTDAELTEFELKEAGLDFTSRRVMTEREYVEALQDFSPHVILSDYDLPQYTGVHALAEARRQCPDIPFILVTGAICEDRAREVLRQGAKDYVFKSGLQRLGPAVRKAISESEEMKKRRNAEIEKKISELRAEFGKARH